MRALRWLILAAADAAILGMSASGIPTAVRLLRSAPSPSVDQAAGAICAAVVQVAAGWLAVGLLAELAANLPGAAGALGRRVASLVLPGLVRRLLAGAAGIGMLAAPAAAWAAAPSPRRPGPASTSTPAPAWPTDNPLPPPRWPADPATSPPAAPPRTGPQPAASAAAAHVKVRPGDSLWAIAARTLPGRPTPSRVAAAWPRWWAANRSVIGPDPDLLHPGQVLTAPAGDRKETVR